jgi:hypothetical protein
MQSTSETFFILFTIILCGALFIIIWISMLFLVARFGGWGKLHKAYKFPERIGNPFLVKTFQSIQLGMSNYNGIMTLSYYPQGLGLEVMFLFRFQHPKILIPWKDIKLKEKSKNIFYWNKLEIGIPPITNISVNNKVLEQINTYINKTDSSEEKWEAFYFSKRLTCLIRT